MDEVTVYDQSGKLLVVLDNADAVSYELKHNDLWTGSFSLPTGDPKKRLLSGAQSGQAARREPGYGHLPHHRNAQRGGNGSGRNAGI